MANNGSDGIALIKIDLENNFSGDKTYTMELSSINDNSKFYLFYTQDYYGLNSYKGELIRNNEIIKNHQLIIDVFEYK